MKNVFCWMKFAGYIFYHVACFGMIFAKVFNHQKSRQAQELF